MGLTTQTPYPIKPGYYETGWAEYENATFNKDNSAASIEFGFYVDSNHAATGKPEFRIKLMLDNNNAALPDQTIDMNNVAASAENVFLQVVVDDNYTRPEIVVIGEGEEQQVFLPKMPAWDIPSSISWVALKGPWVKPK